MERIITIAIFLASLITAKAQTTPQEGVEKACINYLEGFYEGDTSKLQESLQPELNKFGFWKDKGTETYRQTKHMSYDQALAYAKNVLEKKEFAKPDAPKIVEVLDTGNTIASAKVTAWWGTDYLLLSKRGDKWMIEQVIWEGPLEKS